MVAQRDMIGLFLLGGTILSIAGQDGPAESTALLEAAGIKGAGAVDIVPWRAVGSQNLTIPDILSLAAEITRRAEDGMAGFVVVQGTDTMEEVAFLLSLLLPASLPLVLTGAMRTADAAGADGPGNLRDALLAVRALAGQNLGPVICMNGELHAARAVRKVDAGRIGAFASAGQGPLGTVVTGRVRLLQRPLPPPPPVGWTGGDALPKVALVTVTMDADPLLLAPFADPRWAGLVVEGVGSGHVPQALATPLAELAAIKPVMLVSRCGQGDTDAAGIYRGEGTAVDLLEKGLIDGGSLQGRKARLLLTLLCAKGGNRDELRRAAAEWAGLGLLP
ncbi:asparaginase [Niveispirillum irakense]|uniref:asparaginase n=1 Tax=Niveispirillum irakense TaxID=34011 RepID=UPI0006858491|nr:asparaginase domain-containing protein [Niveispirillum irakense]